MKQKLLLFLMLLGTSVAGNPTYGVQQQFTTDATGIPVTGLSNIAIYPNPATQQFTVTTHTYDNYTLEMYNVIGQRVLSQLISQPATAINVWGMANGVYTVTLKKDEAVKSYRLVIVN